ncbi:Zinc finger CCCH domain-containing protein 4 [Acipenser ruthenus]|uniref:Zinc finger CCCH domain-containing protein 4 n=1 Tax=Acipenser ruthenus TaxID=7906 RepID=A0A662YRN9_ACIRT|nr:Zinc finger CCCH domain-containing protein 4 [Acipenser ruthenus]
MGPGPPPGPPGMRPPGPMPHDMSMGPPGMNQGPPPMGPGPPMMPFGPGDGPPQGMMPPGPPPPYFENFENFYPPQQGMEMERGGEQEDDYGDYEEMEQGDDSMGFMDQPLPDQGSMMGLDPGAGQVIAQPTQPAASAIAPYDPRLLSAGGGGRGGGGVGLGSASTGQSSVLSSISLYDPRTQSTGSGGGGGGGGVGSGASTAKSESGNTANGNCSSDPKAGEAGKPVKLKEPLFMRKSALDQPETEKNAGSEQATDRYNSYNRPRPKPAAPPPSATPAVGITSDGSAVTGVSNPESGQQPGVHNLPVSSVFGLKQAAKSGGTGSPFGGSSPAQPADSAEQDAASLKEVFKGFDPTASPFCQ